MAKVGAVGKRDSRRIKSGYDRGSRKQSANQPLSNFLNGVDKQYRTRRGKGVPKPGAGTGASGEKVVGGQKNTQSQPSRGWQRKKTLRESRYVIRNGTKSRAGRTDPTGKIGGRGKRPGRRFAGGG